MYKKCLFVFFQKRKKLKSILRITTSTEQIWSVPFLNSKLTVTFQLNQKNIKELVQKPKKVKDIFVVLDTVFRGQNIGLGNIRVDEKYVGQKLKWNWLDRSSEVHRLIFYTLLILRAESQKFHLIPDYHEFMYNDPKSSTLTKRKVPVLYTVG